MLNNFFGGNKKGITVTSLTIYVIVATIVVGVLVFLNANFFSNINDLTDKAKIVSESLDFKSAFIRDLKSENDIKVTDYNNNLIRLSNNIKYEIRVLDKNAENKRFAIYRNDVQIAKNVVSHTEIDGSKTKEGPYFEYDVNTNTVKVGLKFSDGNNVYLENQTYVVGKQPEITWRNSPNNVIVGGSGDRLPDDSNVPEEDRIYAYLYEDGSLEIGNSDSENSTKPVADNFGEISKTIADGSPAWLKSKNDIKTVIFNEPVNLQSMKNLFAGCTNLVQITNPNNMKVENAKSAQSAFEDCMSLNALDVTSWNTTNVTDMSNMFKSCSNLNEINLNTFITDNVTNMSGMFKNCSNINNLTFDTVSTNKVTNMSEMFSGCSALKNLDLNRLVTSKVTDMSSMFSNCTSLVSLKINYLDVSEVTSISKLFYNCQSLASVTIGDFSSEDITDLSYMFYNCMNLDSITLGNMQTANVTDMSNMFSNCVKLTTINLENLDTQNVQNMENMFYNCQSLANMDFSIFNTENVENMKNMFAGCTALSEISNVATLKTANVKNMAGMFKDCTSIEELDLNNVNFVTTNVADMSEMFSGCTALNNINVNGFDTINVTTMAKMFSNCTSLELLDLTNFNTENVTSMAGMFKGNNVLEKIYVSDLWVTTNNPDMTGMFEGCKTGSLDKV